MRTGWLLLILSALASGCATARTPRMISELENWKNVETSSTAELFSSCGVLGEAQLRGFTPWNVVQFIFKGADGPVMVFPRDAKMIFDQSIERIPVNAQAELRVAPKQTVALNIFFPTKEDFKASEKVTVSIPLKKLGEPVTSCELTVTFSRDLTMNVPVNTYSDRPGFTFSLGLTPPISTIGARGLAGSNYFGLSTYLNAYSGSHGFKFGGIFAFGAADLEYLPKIDENESETLMTALVSAGYAYRHILGHKAELTYSPGIGMHVLSYGFRNREPNETINAAFVQILSYDGRGEWNATGHAAIGYSLFHAWIPKATLQGKDVSGHMIGAMLNVKFGLAY